MTTRLRAGFLIDSKMKTDKDYFFGYLTHAGLDHDVAIAIPTSSLSKYIASDKMLVDFEGMEFRIGMLQTYSDRDGNDIYSVNVFAAGKLQNLIIYPSQYVEMMRLGHHINSYQNSLVLESFVNLNQES